ETLAALSVRHAIVRVDPCKTAAAHTEDQPTVAEVIDCGGFLCKLQRMAEGQDLNGGADFDAAGPRGDRSSEKHRRGENGARRRKVQLGEPDRVQSPAFGSVDQLEGVL